MYVVIRIRGSAHLRRDIADTMRMLRLHHINHCVLVPENDSIKGMLQMAKDYITWGEIDPEVLKELIEKRGRILGDKPINDEVLKKAGYSSFEEFAKALTEGRIKYSDIPEIKPVIRLHPPRIGYEGIKRSYKEGGALGYRGKDINELIKRML